MPKHKCNQSITYFIHWYTF